MNQNTWRVTDTHVKFHVRAKYYRTPEGVTKLAQIQQLGIPAFRLPGFEEVKPENLAPLFEEAETGSPLCEDDTPNGEGNRLRALRRAKINAFNKILANPDLNTFATFTLSPAEISDRASWDDAYHALKVWLSNHVTRSGLKYVICPERHKAGGIHFHGIMNSSALKFAQAINPHTGQPLTHNGNPLYNVTSWRYGFSSAELIGGATLDREKVAKYIFKYMGKQGTSGMIGGRYALIGGKLSDVIYLYGDRPEEFMDGRTETHSHQSEHDGIIYREWNYI